MLATSLLVPAGRRGSIPAGTPEIQAAPAPTRPTRRRFVAAGSTPTGRCGVAERACGPDLGCFGPGRPPGRRAGFVRSGAVSASAGVRVALGNRAGPFWSRLGNGVSRVYPAAALALRRPKVSGFWRPAQGALAAGQRHLERTERLPFLPSRWPRIIPRRVRSRRCQVPDPGPEIR